MPFTKNSPRASKRIVCVGSSANAALVIPCLHPALNRGLTKKLRMATITLRDTAKMNWLGVLERLQSTIRLAILWRLNLPIACKRNTSRGAVERILKSSRTLISIYSLTAILSTVYYPSANYARLFYQISTSHPTSKQSVGTRKGPSFGTRLEIIS